MIGSQYDIDLQASPPPPQPQSYMTVPAGHAGDVRDILRHGGGFRNLNNEPDNLNRYNLSGMGLAASALHDSSVDDLMQGGAVHSQLDASAFNNGGRLAIGGMIQGPGTGTSDSVAAVANGQPVAVSNGEFRVPAVVVQALGQDYFDELVQNYHQPTGKPNGPMPTSTASPRTTGWGQAGNGLADGRQELRHAAQELAASLRQVAMFHPVRIREFCRCASCYPERRLPRSASSGRFS